MLSQNFIWASLAIAVFGNIFYLLDTLKGKTKPNRVTFFLWGVAPLISYFAQRSGGGGKQTFYTLAVGVIPLIILAASFTNKEAYWKVTKFDLACGSLSILALVLLIFSGKPLLALTFSVIADLCAGLPTVIKSYRYPNSETVLAYAFEVVSSILVLLTIHNWTFVNYFFSAYILFMNALFTSLLLLSPKRRLIVS